MLCVGAQFLIDRLFYGVWVVAPLNFLRVNLLEVRGLCCFGKTCDVVCS